MAHPTTLSALPGSSLILRNALIFASVLDRPVRIVEFRGGRNKPGIQPADSALVRLVSRIRGEVNVDVRLGDKEVSWEGGWEGETSDEASDDGSMDSTRHSRVWNASPGPTASLPILLQAALPTLLFADSPSQLHFLAGSSDLPGAPPLDYTINIFLKFIQTHLGFPMLSITPERRGSPPLGRAQLSAEVLPLAEGQVFSPVELLEQGEVIAIRGRIVITGKTPTHALTRARDAIAEVLSRYPQTAEVPLHLKTTREAATEGDRGDLYITIWAETSTGCRLGGSSGGERGRRTPEEAGREAAEVLLRALEGGGCVDSWMQDQLIPYLALAGTRPPPHRSRSTFKAFHPSPKRLSRTPSTLRLGPLTNRAQLAVDVAAKLTGANFEVEQMGDGCILRVWGISWYR